ncbi:MAG: FMN-binding protein [Clostridia bacterium]|nr:FMN-binding protein [Clostridia bacterium]
MTFKNIVKPILVLTLICLAVALLLAVVNYVTSPIIADATAEAERKARSEALPGATEFTEVSLDGYADLPDTVSACYRDNDGGGYVFLVKGEGYGKKSAPITLLVGIRPDGKVAAIKITDVSGETAGIGDKVKKNDFTSRFPGIDADGVDAVQNVSGATYSSTGVKQGVRDAFTAFAAVTKE